MRPQVGQVINNKYRLLRLVGDGGMGSVYEARHEVLGTSVALKFLHAELAKRSGLVQRFLQEARVSAQIQSQHVVRVTDVDQTQHGAFIVMEYLEGRTLQTVYEDLYKAGQRLSYEDALEYAIQMLDGVEAAHKAGIIHRDLKPDNVMITMDAKGRQLLKLLDFGIAKLKVAGDDERGLTRPGVIMGTPEYMAPEQAFSADAVDARADIFSLGVMIFEMLAGRRPVGGDDPHQIAGAYLSGQIAHLNDLAPEVDPALAEAVHRAMAALTGERFATVSKFRDAIEPFAAAVRAPSALPPGPSLSNPGVSRPGTPSPPAASPLETNVPASAAAPAGAAAVPRTLPPEAEAAAAVNASSANNAIELGIANPDATSPAEPPRMSDAPSRGPTPLGGFAVAGQEIAGLVPPTRSVSPLAERAPDQLDPVAINPGATAFAAPFAALQNGTSPAEHAAGVHVAGTAIDEAAHAGSELGGGAYQLGAASPGAAPFVPPVIAPPATQPSRKKGSLFSSLPAILALAASIAGAVVGGLYLAHNHAKADEHEEPPAPPPTTVRSEPPPEPPASNAPPTLAPSHPARPSTPWKTPTRPTSPQPPPPPPSSAPRVPIIPSAFPIVVPTSIPFFPFGPPPGDPPRTRPDTPPPRDPPRDSPRDRPPRGERPSPRDPYDPPGRPAPRPQRPYSPRENTQGPSEHERFGASPRPSHDPRAYPGGYPGGYPGRAPRRGTN